MGPEPFVKKHGPPEVPQMSEELRILQQDVKGKDLVDGELAMKCQAENIPARETFVVALRHQKV